MVRIPDFWQSGEFVAEDGWVFFADAWNHPFPESLALTYAGYFHLVPRLVAAFWSAWPLLWQPSAYAATGLVLNAGILSAFYLPVFRKILEPDRARLVVVLFFALAPNAENLGLILGLHWYLAFGLTLILLVPLPVNPGARIAVFLLVLLSVWSSPSALVLAPVAFLAWTRSRNPSERLLHAVICGMLLLAGILIGLIRLKSGDRTGSFEWMDAIVSLDRLVLRGWIGVGLLGPRLAGYLAGECPPVLDLFTLGVFITLIVVLWRNRAQPFARRAAIILGVALLMLLFSLTRTAYLAELARLALPRNVRYLTTSTLLLYAGLGIIAYHPWPGLTRRFLAPLVVLSAGLLATALPGQVHWSRPVRWFHWREAIPAINELKARYARDGQPASLYVPADIPYWGPVLEVGGGRKIPPEAGLVDAIGATPDPQGGFDSWLGRFARPGEGNWIQHQVWGRIEFTGVEHGRVFFRDPAGRLMFTSPLVFPRLWILDGFTWTYFQPSPR